jgi:hypothetical protein
MSSLYLPVETFASAPRFAPLAEGIFEMQPGERRTTMILGFAVTGSVMLLGGLALFLLTVFQVLMGLRVFKFGKRHRIVHRWVAYAILAIAAVHGLLGVLFVTGVRIG